MLMIPSTRSVGPSPRAADRRAGPETTRAADAVDAGRATDPDRRRKRRRRTDGAEFRIEREEIETATAGGRAVRAYAPLVAQLIATKLGFAQTRERRRGSMEEALDAYRRAKIASDDPRLAPTDAAVPA